MLSVEELKSYRYFSSLSEQSLESLSKKLEKVEEPADTKIIRQGSPPDYFYFLREGEVEVTKRTPFGQSAKITVLGSGESFGEVALLTCSHRTSSVTAKSDVTLLRLGKKDFEETVLRDTAFRTVLEKKAEGYETFNRMKTAQPFALLEPEKMISLAERLSRKRFAPGETIIKEGEKGDLYYIVESGSVEVMKNNDAGVAEKVASLKAGMSFGEEALIREEERKASVRASEETTAMVLDKADFDRILKASFLDYAFPEDFPEEERGKFVFIDARVPPEYEEEHIEGAVNIPLEILREKYQELDADQEYLTYCTNDSRGMAAAFLLSTQGFKARNLRGGLSGWTGGITTGSDGVHYPSEG